MGSRGYGFTGIVGSQEPVRSEDYGSRDHGIARSWTREMLVCLLIMMVHPNGGAGFLGPTMTVQKHSDSFVSLLF